MSSTSGASIRWTRPSRTAMGKARLEAFSDGVIAVIITIMVLELKAPHGTDLAALAPLAPALLTYVLSFVFIGIYWNNHHHMLHAAQHIDGRALWANLHLLSGSRSCRSPPAGSETIPRPPYRRRFTGECS